MLKEVANAKALMYVPMALNNLRTDNFINKCIRFKRARSFNYIFDSVVKIPLNMKVPKRYIPLVSNGTVLEDPSGG